jgi:uncharacterized repeat protein (TIGR01451 family)
MKYPLFTLLITIFSLTFASPALAAQTANCAPIYGGSNSCIQTDPLVINKQVQNPDTDEYVDNLTTNDPTYAPGDTVRFKLTISNSGNGSVRKLTLKEIFPAQIDFTKGAGTYDQKTRTLSFTIDELKSKESKVYFVEGKIASADKLPNNDATSCVINQGEVSEGDKISRDNARVCIAAGTGTAAPAATKAPAKTTPTAQTPTPTKAAATKGGTTIYPPTDTKRTPDTGPEALALIGLAPLGAFGFYLRNKARLQQFKAKT